MDRQRWLTATVFIFGLVILSWALNQDFNSSIWYWLGGFIGLTLMAAPIVWAWLSAKGDNDRKLR